MSYHRNRPPFGAPFGAGPGLYGGPARVPRSRFDSRAGSPASSLYDRRPGASERAAKSDDVASERASCPTAELEAEVARLRGLLADKEREARVASVRTHLADEEIERAKRRIEKSARQDLQRRTRSFLLSFLDVVDDLDRAIAAARDEPGESAVLGGVELVRKGFLDKLARHDVAHRPALGERFDPAHHEAVGMVPVDSADRDGVIVGVIREGYTIGADTLRPASVAVGRYTALHQPTDS